jgi:hypothetical protein
LLLKVPTSSQPVEMTASTSAEMTASTSAEMTASTSAEMTASTSAEKKSKSGESVFPQSLPLLYGPLDPSGGVREQAGTSSASGTPR